MSNPVIVSKTSVIRLYKDLLRYTKQIQYSDKDYYINRVKSEFRSRKNLSEPNDIEYYYKV